MVDGDVACWELQERHQSYELHCAINITQKTAWFLLSRIRLAMQDEFNGGNVGGEVEIDETFVDGKARNIHKDRKRRYQANGRNAGGKTVVLGMLERGGKIRASVIPDRTKASIQPTIRGSVELGTTIHSDEWAENYRMEDYEHQILNHLSACVDENVHCNGVENFWSLLKRTIGGTYVSVERYHLFR